MIRQHPFRVLGVTALVAIAFLALSYPGRGDTKGAWYYISAVGWFGFMLSVLALIILAIVAATTAIARRRSAT